MGCSCSKQRSGIKPREEHQAVNPAQPATASGAGHRGDDEARQTLRARVVAKFDRCKGLRAALVFAFEARRDECGNESSFDQLVTHIMYNETRTLQVLSVGRPGAPTGMPEGRLPLIFHDMQWRIVTEVPAKWRALHTRGGTHYVVGQLIKEEVCLVLRAKVPEPSSADADGAARPNPAAAGALTDSPDGRAGPTAHDGSGGPPTAELTPRGPRAGPHTVPQPPPTAARLAASNTVATRAVLTAIPRRSTARVPREDFDPEPPTVPSTPVGGRPNGGLPAA